MAEIPTSARVVIIGGGAVGASCLYHLAKAGWTDCVLLEKNELTAGSTWHAAGNVPTFSSSWSVMNMQRYSAELYRTLGETVDYPINYHVTGSIRLAHSKERMQEFQRAAGMGRYQGIDIEMIGPNGIRDRYPFIELHDLEGALYDPYDGDIDPAQLTQALAKGARSLGAKICRHVSVTGIERPKGEWRVSTDKGEISCQIVVNAAGYYAQRVGEMFKPFGGRTVPMATMSHQYLVMDELPELSEWSKREGRKLPLLRDVDISYYLRQEKSGLNFGPYERNCRAHWVDPDDPLPEDFSFQLFQDDIDRLEYYIEDVIARVPLMQKAGISKIINGPIPYAPDGMPLIGPMPGVADAFEACVFTFGIAQAGGAGKTLAEWVTEGRTEWDMWSCDPRRYTDYTDHEYCVQKAMETYGHEYAMHFPWFEWPAGRDRKLSPVHDRIKALGGQMGAYNGWERANWFAKPEDDLAESHLQSWGRSGPWEKRVREECRAVAEDVGVLDLAGFARFMLNGSGAGEWLLSRISGVLPRIGRMNLAYFPDSTGRVLTEMSVLRHAEDEFTLITASAGQWHDFELLTRALPPGGAVTVTDRTADYSTLIITGPNSRKLLSGMVEADLDLPWLSLQQARAAGLDVMLARVSFAGELGWEIHCDNKYLTRIYDSIIEAGATPFGMWALNSLRLEKGYRAWKGDLSTDYTILESGLDRFVRFDKPQGFPGKAALLNERQRGSAKRFVTMVVDAGEFDAPNMSTIRHAGEIVGETTSGGWGYRTGKSIALGFVRTDLAHRGMSVEVDIYGDLRPAVIQGEGALWDPQNLRLRA
ncbi:MAG: FAD-dependent oxidoreductase [Rhodobacteraceae bacterium]|nr:FAD-dependent oxidoreductase [Paracoccaceae bacterium]